MYTLVREKNYFTAKRLQIESTYISIPDHQYSEHFINKLHCNRSIVQFLLNKKCQIIIFSIDDVVLSAM